jgi:hypothetical protein
MADMENPARVSDRLEPRRDVYPVAEYVPSVDNDITNCDADAEFHALFFGHIGISFEHSTLNFRGAGDSVHDTWELDEHPVAGKLDDPTIMFGYLEIDELLPMMLESRQRGRFVNAHQSAVANYVCRKNGGHFALNTVLGHIRSAARLDHPI